MLTARQIRLTPGESYQIGKAAYVRIVPVAIYNETVLTQYDTAADHLAKGRALAMRGTRADGTGFEIGIDHRGLEWVQGPFYGTAIYNGLTASICLDLEVTTSESDPRPASRNDTGFAIELGSAAAGTKRFQMITQGRARVSLSTYTTSPTNPTTWAISAIIARAEEGAPGGTEAAGGNNYTSTGTGQTVITTIGADGGASAGLTGATHYAIPMQPPAFTSILADAPVGLTARSVRCWMR